ncbi:MAG: hypothetical protein EPO25_17535 [Gammaproteobacteria bacterium]|nr:MAG: hypothetical protein EPO25_17535 [Gammaproteobacteria bacterium]
MSAKLKVWQLHEPKARFSEVFRRVRSGLPVSLVELLRSAPTGGRPLDLSRKRDTSRTLRL